MAVIPVWISGGNAVKNGDLLLETEKVPILEPWEG